MNTTEEPSRYLPVRVIRVFKALDSGEAIDDTAHRIQFNFSEKYPVWKAFVGPRDALYCFTTEPDAKGRFWAWTYRPVWRENLSEPHHWRMVGLTQAQDKDDAKEIARERYYIARSR